MNVGGFVMVPGWLLARKPSGAALLVYCNLGSHGTWNPGTGRYDECRPAVPTIAEETGLSENTVRKGLRELAELAAIEAGAPRYDQRGGQLPTVYRVVFGQLAQGVQNLNPPGSKSEGDGVQEDTPGGVPKSEPNQEPSTKNPNTNTEKASPSRGARLPEGWKPSPDLGAWMLSKLPEGRWSDHSRRWVLHETEKFTNHWHAAAGANARKLNWDRAWQNWMLRALERYRPAVAGVAPTSGAPAGQFKTAAEKNAEAAQRRSVIYRLADELIDAGMDVNSAVAQATAEVEKREREAIALDPCTVTGYIDGSAVDRDERREVES